MNTYLLYLWDMIMIRTWIVKNDTLGYIIYFVKNDTQGYILCKSGQQQNLLNGSKETMPITWSISHLVNTFV